MKGKNKISKEIERVTDQIKRTKNDAVRNSLLETRRQLLIDQAKAAIAEKEGTE